MLMHVKNSDSITNINMIVIECKVISVIIIL